MRPLFAIMFAVILALPAEPHGAEAAPAPSPYLLPWPGGESFICEQGNNGAFSHTGLQEYAWDFAMPVGSVVLAARSGTVRYVYQDSNVGGTVWSLDANKGNYVVIDQGDGTSALYLHLMYHGALVKVGQRVSQGQPIAFSGATGFASGPHLHFEVEKTVPFDPFAQSIPASFADVSTNNGVPVQGQAYISKNVHVSVTHAPVIINLAQENLPPVATSGDPAPQGQPNDAFVADVNYPDGTALLPGTAVTKQWTIQNDGTVAWPAGTHLELQGISGFKVVSLGTVPSTPPGQKANVSVTLRTPPTQGGVGAYFRLATSSGSEFGDELWIRGQVHGHVPTEPVTANPHGGLYFPQTGHNVLWPFEQFFLAYGGVNTFGYPRTEAFHEGGFLVQYFQRGRMEYHPELPAGQQIQLTLLGDTLTKSQQPFPKSAPGQSSAEHEYFPQTGHWVNYGFLHFFQQHGGLTVFGYPISNEMPLPGVPGGTEQWFQRARLEYHPELAGTPYVIQPGLLGDEYLTQIGWLPLPPETANIGPATVPQAQSQPTPPPPSPSPAPSPTATATPPATKATVDLPASGTATVTAWGLRIHQSPDVAAVVVGYLTHNEVVQVLGRSGDWIHVAYGGSLNGYVDGHFLSFHQ
ncbi:MAG: NBR1-Ig-like domain-containing protein [Chloroflexi bacterium]|nr:NBR1-Ig-like domain-containing protein [Chloroflexota bacterium]